MPSIHTPTPALLGSSARITRLMRVGLGLILVVVAGSLAITCLTLNVYVDTTRWVIHTHEVIESIEEELSLLKDAETGMRGYLLTGDETYLAPYIHATPAIRDTARRIRDLTHDNPQQQKRLDAMDLLIRERMTQIGEFIALRREKGKTPAVEDLRNGKTRMDAIRRACAGIQDTERALLGERTSRDEALARRSIVASAALGVTVLLLLSWLYILLIRHMAGRQRAEADLDRYFQLSLDLACVAGLDGYFKRLNPAWTTTLGFSAEELMARPYIEFVHPEDRASTLAEAGKLAQGVDVVSFENRYRSKNGSWRWLGWTARAPRPGEDCAHATARDITERKEAEEQIRLLNQQLEERIREATAANQELEAFSYSVSHDLRAPLRHIGGFVDLLQKTAAAALDEKARRQLGVISDSTKQMGQLIDDLLAFSRMGRVEMRRTTVSMDAIAEEVRRILEPETRGRRIEWSIAPLPAVAGDPSLLKQVVLNLLSNAVKYSRNREVARIEVGFGSADGEEPSFFVRDNGAGFEMQYANKLFGVFQRLHAAHEFEGTGIGLANVRRIVQRHGGKAWAQGRVGEGATFRFTLPLAREDKS